MLFSNRIRVSFRIRFSVWLVSGYAHVFVLVSVIIITLPLNLAVKSWIVTMIMFSDKTSCTFPSQLSHICESVQSAVVQRWRECTVKSIYFIVRPKVDQRADQLSLPHLGNFFKF